MTTSAEKNERTKLSPDDYMKPLEDTKSIQIQMLLEEIGNRYGDISDNEKLRAEARLDPDFKINSDKDYNFGITGESGVGKSSLVNALCGYALDNTKAAPVNFVECTEKIGRYPHPQLKHVVLYDLPGAGTLNHPIGTYFCDKKLYVFDCLLLVMSERTRQNDMIIARFSQKMGTPVVFVRNKAMQAFKNMRQKHPDTNEAQLISEIKQTIKNDIINNLKKVGIHDPTIFVIDTASYCEQGMKFDEWALIKHLAESAKSQRSELNDSIQHEAETTRSGLNENDPIQHETETSRSGLNENDPKQHEAETSRSGLNENDPKQHETETSRSGLNKNDPKQHEAETSRSSLNENVPLQHEAETSRSGLNEKDPKQHETETSRSGLNEKDPKQHETETASSKTNLR